VYACLSSVSAFDQSVTSASGPTTTRISQTSSPVPLSGLPVSEGVYDLSMPVGVGSTPSAPPGGFSIDLTAAGAQCGAYPSGVYPVRLELVDTSSGQPLGGLTTHLVYVGQSAGTQKLRVAVVLPIQTTLRAARAPSAADLRDRPSAALAAPTPAALDAIVQTVGVLAAPEHSSVPLTLEASPQTLALLGSTGHQATVTQLATLAAPAGDHEFAAAPFVPVDAANLVAAGLQPELGLQVTQGVQVLDAAGTHPAAAAAATAAATAAAETAAPGPASGQRPLGTWFSDSALDTATLTLLQQFGYSRVVLPASTVAVAPSSGSTPEPFTLTTGRGASVAAVTFNADLSSRFAAATSDPVLAAHQLVAELAQIYYERPNYTTARGVAAVAPSDWSASPEFTDALLGALDGSPILQAVTTSTLFDTLGSASCHGCRLGATPGPAGLPAEAIRTERQRINGLFSAAPEARPLTVQLSEVVLAGQAGNLRAGQQSAVVANAGAAIDAQLAQIAVTGDRTITLTSRRGQVPVTIVSAAPYAVNASMTLTSDKLLFANHSTSITMPVTLAPGKTTVEYVNVQSRASGLFKVAIVLRSPVGGMLLSTGQVSVRSTASSIVGIVLSLGAAVVLVAWWIRTSRRRRRDRRAEIPLEASREPVTTG
jgi:Family of unknown function (DUF6049)